MKTIRHLLLSGAVCALSILNICFSVSYGASTSMAVSAAAAERSGSRIRNMDELIRDRSSTHRQILIAYQQERQQLLKAIQTHGGGSPQYHLRALDSGWFNYSQTRTEKDMEDLIKENAPFEKIKAAYRNELGTLQWKMHAESDASLEPVLNHLNQAWSQYVRSQKTHSCALF